MKKIFGNDWDLLLQEEMKKPYYLECRRLLLEEYKNHVIYPDMYHIFQGLQVTSYQDVKVVLLGQDPYHGPGQAHGMAFSVRPKVPLPPSLQNIYKELEDDLGIKPAKTGYLRSWAKEGVLLLNTTLTVRHKSPMSHANIGWEIFTNHIISLLDKKKEPLAFLLWGNHARSKKKLLKNTNHLVLEAPHPSPLSAYRGFFGSKPFSKINEYLINHGVSPIHWEVKEMEEI